jgi:hypothetical protein
MPAVKRLIVRRRRIAGVAVVTATGTNGRNPNQCRPARGQVLDRNGMRPGNG